MDSAVWLVVGKVTTKQVAAAVAACRHGRQGLEITHQGAQFIPSDDRRATGLALALGFVLGAAVAL
jgi:hypothetical protein